MGEVGDKGGEVSNWSTIIIMSSRKQQTTRTDKVYLNLTPY